MYQKLHRKLTLLFTGVTGLILVIMSVCYLYMSEKELCATNAYAFSGDVNTLVSNLEQQNTLTLE